MADEWTTVSHPKPQRSNPPRVSRPAARLARDLAELSHACLPGIAAAPIGDDIFTWTASLCPIDDEEVVFHLVLHFDPDSYPSSPPRVDLCTPIPHRAYTGPTTPLCCDLLDQASHGSKFSGWSSAFGVSSLLLQLQSFLFDPELVEPGRHGLPDMKAAADLAKAHQCEGCRHGPVLPFPSSDQLLRRNATRVVKKPVIRKVFTVRQHQPINVIKLAPKVQAQPKVQLCDVAEPKQAAQKKEQASGWVQVKSRKQLRTITNDQPTVACLSITSHNQFEQLTLNPERKPQPQGPSEGANLNSKAHKKNMRRRAARQLALKQQLALAQEALEAAPAEQMEPQTVETMTPAMTHQAQQTRYGLLDLPERVLVELIILPELTASQVGILAQSCTALCSVCGCGELWKDLFQQHCPHSELTAERLEDWKHAYCCQVTSVMDDLRCFHSKADFEEAILGIPIISTTNPKTRRVDYIDSTMDILSYEAFKLDKVRRTVWKEQFESFLPLFITAEHFERSIPVLEKSVTQLCPQLAYRGQFDPKMVLEVIPSMMVTQMVLLSDKGKHVSDKILEGYCMLHRLLLATVEYYRLQPEVERRLQAFLTSEVNRVKSNCHALGHMYALLSVSEKYTWRQFHHVLMQESFDRAVLWICRANPDISRINDPKPSLTDEQLLSAWLEADSVRMRISMYSVLFLQRVARPQDAPLAVVEQRYDELYGRPSSDQRRILQAGCERILNCSTWPEFFQLSWLSVPSKEYVLNLLKSAVKNSVRKKYHTPGMDFSRVQKSGVSKILLKGETYAAGSHLRHVELQEAWGWSGTAGTVYLDASCLLFSDTGEFLEVIDYARTRSRTAQAAVRHSGDVIDHAKCEGKHTISLDLAKLPRKVAAAYFTFTAFTTTLSDIVQPSMSFHDSASSTELCRYDLEKSCKENTNTAIIMCKLYRESPGSAWKVTAIGHMGAGRASDYDPIIRTIANQNL